MKTLDRQDLTDILYGCAILGTGGGGELEEGLHYIDLALADGKEFRLVTVDEAPSEAMVCTPYMLGAISPLSEEQEKAYARLPRSDGLSMMTAFRRLERYTESTYYGTICCELGGSNTAISFYVAAMIDGYIIDADPAGRAVPEITHSTYYFNDLPAAPIVAANEFGECFICEGVIDDERAEDVVRALAKVSRNDIAAIDHAMPLGEIGDAVIKGTISKAHELGRAFRHAKENESDVANEIAIHGGGFIAFRGHVADFECNTVDGFTIGHVSIEGDGEFAGNKYDIQIKNENLVSRLNGEIHVTIPDLICLIDLDDQEPVTNPNHRIGMNVAVVILPAPEEFTCEKGLSVFGPAYVNLDCEYRPAMELIGDYT